MNTATNRRRILPALALLIALIVHAVAPARAENWPGWRGPRGDGTSAEKGVPVRWDGDTGKGILWKVDLPGKGHAAPIVQGKRIILVTCVEKTGARELVCLDAASRGRTIWRRTVVKGPLETKHRLNSHASSTPATDGERVYTAFLEVTGRTIPAPNVGAPRPVTPGEVVVAAHDFDGEERWKVKVGEFVSAHGFCSSPVIWKDLVIVNGDHDGDAYLVALERKTGKQRWKTPRENKTRSYCTPIIREFDGRTQMILSGSKCVASYAPDTGKRHWIVDGPTEQFVASMVTDGELVFLTGGYPERHILAIRPDGRGNVTDSHVVWRTNRGAGYVPSPIVEGEYFVVVKDDGIASCFDATSGKRYWMERLGSSFSASLVSAAGHVYFQADDGTTTVVKPGAKLEIVARNELGEETYASPAISGGRIYLRGEEHLYCIGE